MLLLWACPLLQCPEGTDPVSDGGGCYDRCEACTDEACPNFFAAEDSNGDTCKDICVADERNHLWFCSKFFNFHSIMSEQTLR